METIEKYIGKMLDGRYELQSLIGEGGMAVVFKALDHRLDRSVAVKIMRDEMADDEEFRQRFCAESHAVAMLSHPNIVAVFDVSHDDSLEYIVMELVDGITLKQYLDKKGAIGWKETLHFSRQIAKALSHAHERGIIHRDIKPQNIMLLKDGTIKVGDFGIAALENEIQENDGQAIGSIHYIAPEQARGMSPDARSDIYSLGVVMYEMLTGQQPYTGDSLGEIAVKHMNAEPILPADIVVDTPPELERIILKAMNADIDERYQSAAKMLDDLDEFTQQQIKADELEEDTFEPIDPADFDDEPTKAQQHMRRRRSARVSFLTGTFGLLLLAVLLFVFLWNFWLDEVFSPAERIELPSFVGSNYDAIVNNAELVTMYDFKVVYIVDTTTPGGTVLSQDPVAGRSMMVTSDGIDVQLNVSTGVVLTPVPDVQNTDYREAMLVLQRAGFVVELENATSGSITRDYVISSSPTAGESISIGSTVYLVVSSGPEINKVEMPNLIGLTDDAAIAKIETAGLSYGSSERVNSEYDAGTVIWQSVNPFSEVEEHTKIFLRVSSGSEG